MRCNDRTHDRKVEQRANDSTDGLYRERHTWRDLGVLALKGVEYMNHRLRCTRSSTTHQLEILKQSETLKQRVVPVQREVHVGNWLSWDDCATQHLDQVLDTRSVSHRAGELKGP